MRTRVVLFGLACMMSLTASKGCGGNEVQTLAQDTSVESTLYGTWYVTNFHFTSPTVEYTETGYGLGYVFHGNGKYDGCVERGSRWDDPANRTLEPTNDWTCTSDGPGEWSIATRAVSGDASAGSLFGTLTLTQPGREPTVYDLLLINSLAGPNGSAVHTMIWTHTVPDGDGPGSMGEFNLQRQ